MKSHNQAIQDELGFLYSSLILIRTTETYCIYITTKLSSNQKSIVKTFNKKALMPYLLIQLRKHADHILNSNQPTALLKLLSVRETQTLLIFEYEYVKGIFLSELIVCQNQGKITISEDECKAVITKVLYFALKIRNEYGVTLFSSDSIIINEKIDPSTIRLIGECIDTHFSYDVCSSALWVDERQQIFSIGVLAYEMLTSKFYNKDMKIHIPFRISTIAQSFIIESISNQNQSIDGLMRSQWMLNGITNNNLIKSLGTIMNLLRFIGQNANIKDGIEAYKKGLNMSSNAKKILHANSANYSEYEYKIIKLIPVGSYSLPSSHSEIKPKRSISIGYKQLPVIKKAYYQLMFPNFNSNQLKGNKKSMCLHRYNPRNDRVNQADKPSNKKLNATLYQSSFTKKKGMKVNH